MKTFLLILILAVLAGFFSAIGKLIVMVSAIVLMASVFAWIIFFLFSGPHKLP
jgi:hypothetical protein